MKLYLPVLVLLFWTVVGFDEDIRWLVMLTVALSVAIHTIELVRFYDDHRPR